MDEPEVVTIVFGRNGERVVVSLLRVEALVVIVGREGQELRFSRKTGFELKPGGSWSAWRLAGKDHRRFKTP